MKNELDCINVELKTGNEAFLFEGNPISISLLQFWQWSDSDLMNNTTRGKLAEFIVANALGIADTIRQNWEPYDLVSSDGIKVEVKSAAYIQSWHQTRLSTITFDVKPTYDWNPENNEYGKERRRQADVYVFCVLSHKEQETINPLNLDQWDFYVLPTEKLDRNAKTQKSISLSRIIDLGAAKVDYDNISHAIRKLHSLKAEY